MIKYLLKTHMLVDYKVHLVKSDFECINSHLFIQVRMLNKIYTVLKHFYDLKTNQNEKAKIH